MTKKLEAKVFRWEELKKDTPIPLIERRRIFGEQMTISEVTLEKGCYVATHSHSNEQFAIVLSGRVKFGLGAEGTTERYEVDVQSGEVVFLPANVPHSAEALETTLILDIFSPVCQDTGIDLQGRA